MAGKFLKRTVIIDTIKSEQKMNSLQARSGAERYYVDTIPCGCLDDNCGAFHRLVKDRSLPSSEEADETLRSNRR